MIANILFQNIFLSVFVLAVWHFFVRQPASALGLKALGRHWKGLLWGALIGIISISALFFILLPAGQIRLASRTLSPQAEQLLWLPVFLAVGFSEELLFRGFMLSILGFPGYRFVPVILSGIVFAFMHAGNPGAGPLPFLNLFLFSLLASYMFLKSGALWMSIGMHITWNASMGILFGFPVSGLAIPSLLTVRYPSDTIWNGGVFGPEGSLSVTILLLLAFPAVRAVQHKKQPL